METHGIWSGFGSSCNSTIRIRSKQDQKLTRIWKKTINRNILETKKITFSFYKNQIVKYLIKYASISSTRYWHQVTLCILYCFNFRQCTYQTGTVCTFFLEIFWNQWIWNTLDNWFHTVNSLLFSWLFVNKSSSS